MNAVVAAERAIKIALSFGHEKKIFCKWLVSKIRMRFGVTLAQRDVS